MNKIRRVIKKDARAALKGNWASGIGITLVLIFITTLLTGLEVGFQILFEAPGFVTEVINSTTPWVVAMDIAPFYLMVTCGVALLSALVTAPLQVGFADWGTACTEGKNPSVGHVFWPYGSIKFFSSGIMNIAIYIKSIIWSVIFFAIPMALIGGGGYVLYYMAPDRTLQATAITALLAGGVLMIIMGLLLCVFLTRYALAPYLMGRRYGKGWFSALRLSVRYTKGHRWETFIFGLSFIPWIILSALIIPIFFLVPYMQVSYAMYTRYLCELYQTGKQSAGEQEELEVQNVTLAEPTTPQMQAEDVGIEDEEEPAQPDLELQEEPKEPSDRQPYDQTLPEHGEMAEPAQNDDTKASAPKHEEQEAIEIKGE